MGADHETSSYTRSEPGPGSDALVGVEWEDFDHSLDGYLEDLSVAPQALEQLDRPTQPDESSAEHRRRVAAIKASTKFGEPPADSQYETGS